MRKALKIMLTTFWAIAWVVIVVLFFFFHCINLAMLSVEDFLSGLLGGIEEWVQSKWDYL